MAVQDIYNALNNALSGGAITLTATTVADLGPTLLAYGITSSDSLALTGATLSLSNNTAILTGTGSYRNFNWTVTLVGDTVSTGNRFSLTMVGQDSANAWTFGTSFTNLPQSRVQQDDGALPMAPSVLLPLVVTQPQLSVTTVPPVTPPAITQKLRLQGGLLLNASLFTKYLTFLGSSQFQLDGTIEIASTDPIYATCPTIIDLTAVAPSASLNIPPAIISEMGLTLRSHYPDIYAWDEPPVISAVALYAKIQIGTTSPDYATVSAPLLQGDGVWPLSVTFSTPFTVKTGFQLITEFFGLPSDQSSLFTFPFADSVLNSFGLTGVELGIQPPLNGNSIGITYASVEFQATDTGLQWIPSLPFVEVTGLGTGWIYHWYGDTKFVTGTIWGELTFFQDTSNPQEVQDGSNTIVLVVNAAIPQFILTAQNKGDINVPLGNVLKKYFGGSGGIADTITVTSVQLECIPPEQFYSAYMLIEGIWSFQVGTVTFSLDQIMAYIFANGSRVFGEVGGQVSLIVPDNGNQVTKATFAVSAEYRQDGTWKFAGGLAEGTLSLTDFVFGLMGHPASSTLELPNINLLELWLTYETAESGSDNPYSARGALELKWNPIGVLGLTSLSLTARASYARRKAASSRDFALLAASPQLGDGDMISEGSLSGTLQINGLSVTMGLSFVDTQKVYLFEVAYGTLVLRAVTRWIDDTETLPAPAKVETGPQHEILVITLSGVTLGSVVEYLINLANPNQNYHLDSPWDFLNDIDLSRFELQIDPSPLQTITLLYNIDLTLPFLSVDSVGVRYDRSTGEGIVNFVVFGKFLDKDYTNKPLTWDAVNDPPPKVPGKGDQFIDLRYLGMGQHISLSGLTTYQSVADVLQKLRDEMKPPKDMTSNPLSGSAMKFDASSQWMFGIDITVLETVSVGIVLHDPDLYGLVVSLAGTKAGSMAGLSFELLYKKVTDDIGVFRVRLQVPDAFRQIMLGPVSITLGIITVDVFTNGNFLVDLGFPHNRDFSASFGLQVGPFIGSGGIYFGVLNGATSQRVPAITNGVFNPVIELGVGLSAGVGRTFDKGPLKAGVYVQILAIFEGVLGWFHPTDQSAPTVVYYWAQASAGIMGKLYGSVDFAIIKVSVSVEASAIVTVTFAAYRHTDVELDVNVEVHAEVEFLFFSISFSFSLRLHTSFTIGEDQVTPWILAADQTGHNGYLALNHVNQAYRRRPNDVKRLTRMLHLSERCKTKNVPLRLTAESTTYDLNWQNIPVFPGLGIQPVTVKMLPAYGVDKPTVQWSTAPSAGTAQYRITFLLMVDTGVSASASSIAETKKQTVELSATAVGDTDSAFNIITEGMFRWAVSAMGINPVTGSITPGQLDELSSQLDMPETVAALTYDVLASFFTLNFEFQISGIPSGSPTPVGGAAFPIPPPLGWDSDMTPPDTDQRRFLDYQMIDANYEAGVQQYFEETNPQTKGSFDQVTETVGAPESMAKFVFREYFLMIAKAAVQAAIGLTASFPYTVLGTEKLTDICALFPTITSQYTKHAGDTVDQVAHFYGYSSSEILALNPTLQTTLDAAAVGTEIAVVLGVTSESLVAGNPAWPIKALSNLQLGNIDYQVDAGDTLTLIATRFGSDIVAWLASADLLTKRMFLRTNAPLPVAASSYVNANNLALDLVAALFYVRLRGADHLGVADSTDVPFVEWYAQAIGDLNTITGPLPATLLVPKAFDDLTTPITWQTIPGDTLWSVAATFAIVQNQANVPDFAAWLQSIQALNPGAGPFPRVILPAAPSSILPYETLQVVGLRLPIEFPIPGQPGQYYNQVTSFQMLVQGADILTPLAPITVPNCQASSTTGQTLSSFAQLYDLSLEQLGSRLAGVAGLLAATTTDQFYVPHPPSLPLGASDSTPTPSDLVPVMLKQEGATISSQVSRFMMYGMRMPAPVETGGIYYATGPMTGLYELVGQQLTGPIPPTVAPTPPYTNVLSITVQNFSTAATPWLKFYDSTALNGDEEITDDLHRLNAGLRKRASTKGIIALTAPITEIVFTFTNHDLFVYYPATILQPSFTTAPAALPLSQDVAVQHSLPQRVFWQTTETIALPNPNNQASPLAGMPTLWKFGGDLLQAAITYSADNFQLWMVDSNLGASAKSVEPNHYAWASTVTVRIKPIAGRPNTYELFGADVADRQELLDIWEYLNTNKQTDSGSIHILYDQSVSAGLPTGLSSATPSGTQTFVVKTNLSTETHSGLGSAVLAMDDPPLSGDFYAPITDALGFLKLVWECSVVGGGGYWFQYTTPIGAPLPGSIFQGDGGASITLLITLASQMNATTPDRHLHSFNNVVIVGDSVNAGSAHLYVAVANNAEVVPQATVAPGNIAFGATLPKPPKNTNPPDRQILLRQTYSLLAYSLVGDSVNFKSSNPALPTGPGAKKVQGIVDENTWDLNQVIPISRFAITRYTQVVASLPDPLDDPYAGIAEASGALVNANVTLTFRDILGNTSAETGTPAQGGPDTIPIPVGYTDPIVGVSSWPGTTTSFQVSPPQSGAGASLTAYLALQASSHLPSGSDRASVANAAATNALARFTQAYYQLSQPKITVNLLTTLETVSQKPIALTTTGSLWTFAAGACSWLNTASQLGNVYVNATTTPTLAAVSTRYGVGYDQLAQANADVPLSRMFASSTGVNIPNFAVYPAGATVAGICPNGSDPAAILGWPENIVLILRAQGELVIPNKNYVVPVPVSPAKTLSLREIANANFVSLASLIQANESTPALLQVGFVFVCNDVEVEVSQDHPDVKLSDVAATFVSLGVQLDALSVASMNADQQGMLRSGATLVIDGYIVKPGETLSNNDSGITAAVLAPLNINVIDLFSAGTTLYVGSSSAADVFNDPLSSAAKISGVTPEQLLWQNSTVALIPQTGTDDLNLAVPGQSAFTAQPANLRIPFSIPNQAKLNDIAALFMNADSTGTTAAPLALANANLNLPGVLAGAQTITVGSQHVQTQDGDSFATVLSRFNPAVQLSDVVTFIGGTAGFLATNGLLLTPPGVLQTGANHKPSDIALLYTTDVTRLAISNASITGLIVPGINLSMTKKDGTVVTITTGQSDTFNSLSWRFAQDELEVSVTDIVTAQKDIAFLTPAAKILLSPATATLTATVGNIQGWRFPSAIFPLHVYIQISRDQNLINPDFVGTSVQSDRSTIPPVPSTTFDHNDDGYLKLQQFATDLQGAIPALRVATGKLLSEERKVNPTDVWCVGFGTGYIQSVAIQPGVTITKNGVQKKIPQYYALRPLANSLVSRKGVSIQPLKADGTLDTAVLTDYQGIDLENWAVKFLADVDLFLSAPYAAQLYQTLQRSSLESVISKKAILAAGIANGLDYVLDLGQPDPSRQDPQPPDWADARESLRQQLLVNLSKGYDIDAILQYQATVTSPWTALSARLSGPGTLKNVTTDIQRSAQISTAKTVLTTTQPSKPSYVNFTIDVSELGKATSLEMDFDYGINEVEFNIDPVVDGYDASDWLSLMLPFSTNLPTGFTVDLGSPNVPLPLRSYPPAPSLLAQEASPPSVAPVTYTDALHWEYAFTYQHQSLAVDHLQLEVTFNQTPPVSNLSMTFVDDLFSTLAQYIAVAPDLWAILQGIPSVSTSTPLPADLANAIQTFSGLVTRVATQWNTYWTTSVSNGFERHASTGQSREVYKFSTKLTAVDNDYTTLTLTRTEADGTVDWPTMSVIVPGSEAQPLTKGTPSGNTCEYTFPDDVAAFGLLGFEMRFIGLHVAQYQNATSQVSVLRNEDLTTDAPTTDAFVFQTTPIAFPDWVIPLLSWRQEFPIGAWSDVTAQNPLNAVFNNVFNSDPANRTISVGIRYGYVLAEKGSQSITPSLPVKYRPSFTFQLDPATGTVKQIIGAVDGWRGLNHPATDGSKWMFSLTMYSSITGQTDRPVLEFSRLSSINTVVEPTPKQAKKRKPKDPSK